MFVWPTVHEDKAIRLMLVLLTGKKLLCCCAGPVGTSMELRPLDVWRLVVFIGTETDGFLALGGVVGYSTSAVDMFSTYCSVAADLVLYCSLVTSIVCIFSLLVYCGKTSDEPRHETMSALFRPSVLRHSGQSEKGVGHFGPPNQV